MVKWPALELEEWKDTYATLHMWTQIVGKIRLSQMPWINHSWHVTLYPTVRGLTTLPVSGESGIFQIDFDFTGHRLIIQAAEGGERSFELRPMTVAEFYEKVVSGLGELGFSVEISAVPNEVMEPVPFARDREHASYDPDYAARAWKVMLLTSGVFNEFRARFIGKCSPVHFFWGAFDLAVTRFSGRRAPQHPGGFPHMPDWITREAYSHEVSSCGFWPGGGPLPYPLYYSYAYPEPEGFSSFAVGPKGAAYNGDMREFVLPYEEVRTAASPEKVLMEFLQSTYEAAAEKGRWDRKELERGADPREAEKE